MLSNDSNRLKEVGSKPVKVSVLELLGIMTAASTCIFAMCSGGDPKAAAGLAMMCKIILLRNKPLVDKLYAELPADQKANFNKFTGILAEIDIPVEDPWVDPA